MVVLDVLQSGVPMLTSSAQVAWSSDKPSILFYNNSRLRKGGEAREDSEMEIFQGLIKPVQVGKLPGREIVASPEVRVQLIFGYNPVAAKANEPLQPPVDHQVKLVEEGNACDLVPR